VQAYCAWKTAQDGQLVRYRVITEAEHQLIRSNRDRMDAYLLGDSSSSNAPAGAGAVGAAAGVVSVKPAAGKAGGKQAVNITVTVGGAGAGAAAGADGRAENVDMVMVVGGQDAVKVGVEGFGTVLPAAAAVASVRCASGCAAEARWQSVG
jgi:hypothetical protein